MYTDDSKTIVTPEQVPITYTIAGVGTRFGAILADTLLQTIALAILGFALALLSSSISDRLSSLDSIMSGWVTAVVILVAFGILWGYFIAFETFWNGQTPGKRWCGIRVIRDSGHPIDFRTALLRNICRYVDFLPSFYGVGALAMFFSKDSKRLGDYVAGTIVVVDTPARWREVSAATPDAPSASASSPDSTSTESTPTPASQPVQYQLLGDSQSLNLRAMTREQYRVIDHFLSRRQELPEEVAQRLAQQIALPLLPTIGMTPPATAGYPYGDLLAEIADAYRVRHTD